MTDQIAHRRRASADPSPAPALLSAAAPKSPDVAAVQLVDARAAAAVGSMSVSWWHQAVADGTAPQPEFRAPRCTRWRLVDVVAFWARYRPAPEDTGRLLAVTTGAAAASAHARQQRRTQGRAR